jgi:hypothetical protein
MWKNDSYPHGFPQQAGVSGVLALGFACFFHKQL